MNLNLTINKDKCIHCGLCIKDCMGKVLAFDENKTPKVVPEREKTCIHCQHCLTVCPTGALSILNKDPKDSIECQNNFNSEELLELIKERRSIRHYKNENVDKDTIQKLKNMLHYVPTGVNSHRLKFTFVEDKEVMEKIRTRLNETIIKLVRDKDESVKAFERYAEQIKAGNDVILRGAPHMVIVSNNKKAPCRAIDPIIALSYFELYAKSLNIGTCWCGLAYYCFSIMPFLKEIANIPNTHEISYVMLFGYPEFKYKRTPQPEEYEIKTITEI